MKRESSIKVLLAFAALGLILAYQLHIDHQARNPRAVQVGTMSSLVGPHGDLVVTITGAGQAECLRAVTGATTNDNASHTFVINGKDYDFPPWGFTRPIWDACNNNTNDIRITEAKRVTAPQHSGPFTDGEAGGQRPHLCLHCGLGWLKIDIQNEGKDKCMAAIIDITRQEDMDLEVAVDGVKGHVDHVDPQKAAQELCGDKSEQIVFTPGASPLPATTNAN